MFPTGLEPDGLEPDGLEPPGPSGTLNASIAMSSSSGFSIDAAIAPSITLVLASASLLSLLNGVQPASLAISSTSQLIVAAASAPAASFQFSSASGFSAQVSGAAAAEAGYLTADFVGFLGPFVAEVGFEQDNSAQSQGTESAPVQLAGAIQSDPPTGAYPITNLYVTPGNRRINAEYEGGLFFASQPCNYVQPTAETVWTINHQLGYRPSVTIFDTDGDEVIGEIDHVSVNELNITFSSAIAGTVHLV
ncbi:MAG: hypothetical protein AAFX44_06585 [Pseudomonadota bacterium]